MEKLTGGIGCVCFFMLFAATGAAQAQYENPSANGIPGLTGAPGLTGVCVSDCQRPRPDPYVPYSTAVPYSPPYQPGPPYQPSPYEPRQQNGFSPFSGPGDDPYR